MFDDPILYWIIGAAIVLPYCATALIRWRRRKQQLKAPEPKRENNYVELRAQALHGKCGTDDVAFPDSRAKPCAVVMDWAIGSGIATVVAVSDGTASVYLSSGGGSIGGSYAVPRIREAAIHAVSIAANFLDAMLPTSDFPLPEAGGVIFYVVTDCGVYMAKASVELLSTNRHPLSALGNDMQAIVTAYRVLETATRIDNAIG